MQKITFRYETPYTSEHLEIIEREIVDLLFSESGPIQAAILSDADVFSAFPGPSRDPLTGKIRISGDISDSLHTILEHSPKAVHNKGHLVIPVSVGNLRHTVEMAYLAYLSRHLSPRRRLRISNRKTPFDLDSLFRQHNAIHS
ncbi:hypothetical protein [Peromfec virus RodF8_22]|uniref:Uncharacterized protein n=1 Tax=Peromfec virus RodF8_22 TaxID=2929364 RepID=A0A976N1U6_9VIRU|nr:hypothetical protein [Peromfec virus RodF8_22]